LIWRSILYNKELKCIRKKSKLLPLSLAYVQITY
jgi:hypothetical protein